MKTKTDKLVESVTAEDIEKLPKRFRAYIGRMQQRLNEFEGAQRASEETRVILDPYGAREFLKTGSEIRFMVWSQRLKRFSGVGARLRDPFSNSYDAANLPALELNATDSMLKIYPNASNSIYVEVV